MADTSGNNRQRTIIIVVVIAVILLCCCCPAVGYGVYWLWQNGDQLISNFSQALPPLLAL
jgi:hypothetical protein